MPGATDLLYVMMLSGPVFRALVRLQDDMDLGREERDSS